MTEKIKQKAEEWVKHNSDESIHSFIGEQLQKAYIAGATENGIQWHDLRKDPEDTPPLGVIVMTYDFIKDTYRFTVGAEKEWYRGRQIAWRKLPEPPEK